MAMADDLPTFEPLARETVSEQIRGQLLQRILSGELRPGTPLPSERVLCEHFDVARTSVREAIHGLMSLGVIERRGRRAHVVELLPEVRVPIADQRKDTVRQLFETRRVLELPIFELAAGRATDDERRDIAALADSFRADLALTEFRRLDRQFHTTLAAACGNPLLFELYGKVLDALFRSGEFESLLFDEVNEAEVAVIVAESAADHRAIADAIVAGDPVAVVARAEQHLGNVEQRMLEDLL
jgi:GntR family transcriptional regulator, transcriptional repressor for pyruvate dehydrogenase complex